MHPILENPLFHADFEQLADVTLNPERHTAANALAHARLVADHAARLARLNACSDDETQLLVQLGFVHDIGKIAGTANPSKSVELLPKYGLTEPGFVELVRYHDVNLSWFIASSRGQPPTDKAWRKLASRVDVRLLCLFMVADRADCPGGWRANAPLMWFLEEARTRGLFDFTGASLDP